MCAIAVATATCPGLALWNMSQAQLWLPDCGIFDGIIFFISARLHNLKVGVDDLRRTRYCAA